VFFQSDGGSNEFEMRTGEAWYLRNELFGKSRTLLAGGSGDVTLLVSHETSGDVPFQRKK
jgi:hypothetical protein